MGGRYKDVRKEIEEVIIKFMIIMPKISIQLKHDSIVYVGVHTPSNYEGEAEEKLQASSPSHIIMGTESMQVDSTHITIDMKENIFVGFGANIVGNIHIITSYSSSDEDEEEKKK